MVDYEKGSASWDLGMILTRHGAGITKNQNGTLGVCARVANLRVTADQNMRGIKVHSADQRLAMALLVKCTCGAGDSDTEKSSILKEEKNQRAEQRTGVASSETGSPQP